MKKTILPLMAVLSFIGCQPSNNQSKNDLEMTKKVEEFATFRLTSNISHLSENQKQMLGIFFEVADIMDNLFWQQAYSGKENALALSEDTATKKFIEINYGPWERLNDNKSFVNGIDKKPLGASFYPTDMTKEEFDDLNDTSKYSLYTLIQRKDDASLKSVPYHEAYYNELKKASDLMLKASVLAEDEGFKRYLELRSAALLNSDYLASDLAWMDMKSNKIDFVVGPIENYEDHLYGYKAAFEAYILLKDMEWSKKLERFSALLPELQKRLPVEDKYKAEVPGSNSDLGAYDVIYYAGDCNAGSKTIAINLPNDPRVHAEKGSRRLQLKNAMQAKFDKILVPIAELIIDQEQKKHITFDAFFENTMYHEVAHGIGIHHVIGRDETVRKALKDKASSLEEGKADILGLFIIDELAKMGEIETDIRNNYVTFTAGLFRSIRFGASSAHGVANLVRYNYFKEQGAFSISDKGIYSVDYDNMNQAIESLTQMILKIQGDGNYEAAVDLVDKYGSISPELKVALDKINNKKIPVDIVFEQGPEFVGL